MKYDKINFLYRNEKGMFSPYMYFEGLKNALERNGLLYYAFDVLGSEPLNMDEMLKYPVLCITGSSPPLVSIVAKIYKKQFLAEIWTESFCTSGGVRKDDLYTELLEASAYFDLYFSGLEVDLNDYWGKPCYWLPAWANVEILGDYYDPMIFDRLGFIGQRSRRKEFFAKDVNQIITPANTVPQNCSIKNLIELCKGINIFKMMVNPQSTSVMGMPGKAYEIMACNRICFNQLDDSSMFKTRELFEDNQDLVYFESFDELEYKFEYYRKKSALMERIAMSGFRKVRQYHSADVRARQIAERVLHHANNGSFKPEFNEVEQFSPADSGLFAVKNSIPRPMISEMEARVTKALLQIPGYAFDVLDIGTGEKACYFSGFCDPDKEWLSILESDCKRLELLEMANIFACKNVRFCFSGNAIWEIDRYIQELTSLERKFGCIFVKDIHEPGYLNAIWPLLDHNGVMLIAGYKLLDAACLPDNAYCLKAETHHLFETGVEHLLVIAKGPEHLKRLKDILSENFPGLEIELFINFTALSSSSEKAFDLIYRKKLAMMSAQYSSNEF